MPYNIYNLVNENSGGDIITYDAGPALSVSNIGTGVTLALLSSPTTAINVTGAPAGGNTIAPLARFISSASAGNALLIGRGVAASPTVPMMVFGHVSAASAPVMEFIPGGGWVSITSVVLTTVSNFNGAIRIKVGTGYHWIPTLLDAGLVGAGAF